MTLQRIAIFGLPGSGKSTFALKLSQTLHLPLFHLDKYFFVHNWKERDHSEFLAIQQGLVEKEGWIIDGNSVRSLDMRFCRATTVFYFRFNRLLCLWRILKRRWQKDPHISDRAEGCKEQIRWALLRYLWGFEQRVRPSLEILRKKYPSVSFYEFHSDREVETFLQQLSSLRGLKK